MTNNVFMYFFAIHWKENLDHTVYNLCKLFCLFKHFIVYILKCKNIFSCYDARIQHCCNNPEFLFPSHFWQSLTTWFSLVSIHRIVQLLLILLCANVTLVLLIYWCINSYFLKKCLISFKCQSKSSTVIFQDLVTNPCSFCSCYYRFLIILLLVLYLFRKRVNQNISAFCISTIAGHVKFFILVLAMILY